MTLPDLTNRIHGLIDDALCLLPHAVEADSRFCDLTDDFGKLEIIMAAEDLADVEISDEEVERIQTVGDLVAHLAERLGLVEIAA